MPAFPSTIADRIQFDSAVRVQFNTSQIRTGGGRIVRVARWSSALRAWPLDIGDMTDSEWQTLQDFYISVGGPLHEFTLTEPITGVTYTAHFADDTLEISLRDFEAAAADGVMIEELRP